MKLVFMGTPDFALPSLRAILRAGHTVHYVVTQPDRPSGRGLKVTRSPVGMLAEEMGLPLLCPERVREPGFLKKMRECDPDAIVVVAFGQKIPGPLLNLPRYGCINVHASLLPKYRGAAPIQWAIMNGETETGVTTIYLDEGWDTGDIILQKAIPIDEDATAGDLHDVLAQEGAELLVRTLELVGSGCAPRIPQDDSRASYAPAITKEDARIDWSRPAHVIRNLIRGMSPYPGAYTFCNGRLLKIFKGEALWAPGWDMASPGEVIAIEEGRGFIVATGSGALLITELQPENRKRMSASDYVHGRGITAGVSLG